MEILFIEMYKTFVLVAQNLYTFAYCEHIYVFFFIFLVFFYTIGNIIYTFVKMSDTIIIIIHFQAYKAHALTIKGMYNFVHYEYIYMFFFFAY